MRRNFILFILIPLVIVGIVVYLFIDSWIEAGLERAGEEVVGAKVEIDHLRLSLIPVGIRFVRLQVADPQDPWHNLVETGEVRFAMDANQLLRGKYIIETIEVRNLLLGTKRSSDGSLPPSRRGKHPPSLFTSAISYLESSARSSPFFDLNKLYTLLNVDSLVKAESYRSVQHLDSLKDGIQASAGQWDGTLRDLERSKDRLTRIATDVRAIDVKALNTPERITAALGTVQNAYTGVTEIKSSIERRRDSVTASIGHVAGLVSTIDDAVRQDLARIMRLVRLPDISTRGLAELVFGTQIYNDVARGLYWMDWARTNVPRYLPHPPEEAPRRFEGQDIRFPEERSYPKFWIKRAYVTGETGPGGDSEAFRATGELRNLSSNQHLTGAPLTINLSGSRGGLGQLRLACLFDRRAAVPLDQYQASLSGLSIGTFELGRSGFLPSRITDARLNAGVEVTIPGNAYDVRTSFQFSSMKVLFDSTARNTVERLVREVLSSVTGFNAGLRIRNAAEGPDIAFSTNLDALLAARVQSVVGAELTRIRSEIESKLNALVASKRSEVESLYRAKRAETEQRLKTVQDTVQQSLAQIEAKRKELNDRLQALKKSAIERAVEGILKKKP